MASKGQSQQSESGKNDAEIDKELDELLKSALEDFSDEPPKHGVSSQAESTSEDASISDVFSEDISEEMAKQFEDAIKTFMGDDPGLLQQMEKMAEAAGSSGDQAESGKEFNEALKQTLTSLKQNTEDLQDHTAGAAGGSLGHEDFMKRFTSMGLEENDPDAAFMPMMQGMMKTLLSKEVLYPSLKEIGDKYPDWLRDNQTKVKDDDYNKYSKQYDIIKDILVEFEEEKESDSEDVKKTRFDKVMDLMQKMQDLGQPPSEIVGDMAPGLEFDANGVPKFPGSPEACAVM